MENTLQSVQTIVSYFVGGNPIPYLDGLEEEEAMKSLTEAARFPLSTTWQPAEFRLISHRTYNVAASCNVPPFSGWENEQFSTKLLRRRCQDNDYWLHVHDKKITGCLSAGVEEEIKRQFDLLESLEPDIPKSNFEQKLKLVKQSAWFKEKLEDEGSGPDLSAIAQYGEDEMLELFLAYSSMCLEVAKFDDNKKSARRREQLALSVLLPLVSICMLASQIRRIFLETKLMVTLSFAVQLLSG